MSQITSKLSGHQSFAFRYGWLEKGYQFYRDNHHFSVDEAMVSMGVGKNMVQSIAYWMSMADIKPSFDDSTPSLGDLLIGDTQRQVGYDMYLENDASLWLIHWQLCSNPSSVTAAAFAFSYLYSPIFSKSQLESVINRHISSCSSSTIKRDIDCFIHCYAGVERTKSQFVEDTLCCPLENLGLVHRVPDQEEFKFSIGYKPSLPPEIIWYSIADYLKKSCNGQTSTNLKDLLYSPFSPGQVFKLSENALVEALIYLTEKYNDQISFSETVGVDMAIVINRVPNPFEILNLYYQG